MNCIACVEDIIVLLMIISAILSVEWRDLLAATVGMAAVSLFASILFFLLQAPDVAMTEAAIGAALSGAVFIFAIKRTTGMKARRKRNLVGG